MTTVKNEDRPGRMWVYPLALIVVILALGAIWLQVKFSEPALPKIGRIPDFELTERSGSPVRLADLHGKVWLADFVYTTCPGTCPMLSSRLSVLQEEAFRDDGVRFVSISVNPEHDTPGVLQQYAEKFRAVPDKWLFLTGEKSKVRDLVNNGFRLVADDAPQDAQQELVHSTKMVLVDQNGVIRVMYDGTTGDEKQKILRDIRRLLTEH